MINDRQDASEKNRPLHPPSVNYRRHAEKILRERKKGAFDPLPTEELEGLVQELEILQIELQVQNEELRESQAALETSRDRYADLYDSAPVGYVTLDDKGIILESNLTLTKLLRREGSSLIGKPFFLFVDEESRDQFHHHFRMVFNDKSAQQTEIRIKKSVKEAAATLFWGEMESVYIETVEGKRRCRSILRDVTERKQQEAALSESREQVARQSRIVDTTLSSITDFAYIFDKEGRFIYSNQALLDLLGITVDEIVGKNFFDLHYPNDLAGRLQRQIQTVITTKATVVDETEFTSPAGVSGYYEYIFSPVLAGDGSVEVVAGSTRDITLHKQIEKALQESEEKSRNILESITDAFFALDPAWRFTYINRQAERLLDRAPGDLLGQIIWEVYPGFTGTEFERAYRQAATDRIASSVTSFYQDHNRWYEVRVYPAPSGITVYFRNVTERLEAEEALRRQAAELERVNLVKDEFLATLSHELRTPLNAILGWTTLLRSQKLDLNAAERALETIERNARAQNRLIGDILDVSKIIMGKLRLEIEQVDFTEIIRISIDNVRPAAEAKKIELVLNLLPMTNTISGDADRLQQIIWNLLSNAIKFTPPGGRIEVRLEQIGSQLELEVRDSGSGIDPEFLPFVFDRLRQAASAANRSHGGLGLGLAIVRHLVELHGGTVRAKSPGPELGATFVVTLPFGRDISIPEKDHAPLTVELQNLGPLGALPELPHLNILVVDDEPDARDLMRSLLEKCGAKVTTAGSVKEALEAFERLKPEVVVSDIGMPGEDGYVFIQKLRALEGTAKQIPAVALTAYAREQDRDQALSAGYQLHISKPIDSVYFAKAIASLVNTSRPSKSS